MSITTAGDLPFGVSQFTTVPWTFDEDIDRLSAFGVATIEIVEDKLDAGRWSEQMRAVADAGLEISGVQPSVRTVYPSRMMPGPIPLGEREALLRQSIERLAPYARGATFMVSTGPHPSGDMAEAMHVTASTLRRLGRVASDQGVTIGLEPLNPSSLNVESMIWTVDQAIEVIDRADDPQVGLCLDLWNVWQNAEVEDQIGRAAGRILTVQLGDWRTPRSFADRVALGTGDLPLEQLLADIRRSGYDGPYILELFHDDVPDRPNHGDITSIIERSRDAFRIAWLGLTTRRE